VASDNIPSPLGAFDGGAETQRIRMTLMAGVPEVDASAALLGDAGHRAIDSWRWARCEQMTNESNLEQ
jgi:hypothetical protein